MAKNPSRQKILAPTAVMQHAFWGPHLFWEGGRLGVSDFVVLNVFPNEVPVVFPIMYFQHVPNSSSLHPIFFASCFTPATYINSPKEEVTIYPIWNCSKVDLFSCFW